MQNNARRLALIGLSDFLHERFLRLRKNVFPIAMHQLLLHLYERPRLATATLRILGAFSRSISKYPLIFIEHTSESE